MLTMYDNHNAIKTERVATYNSMAGGAVPAEFYMSQGNVLFSCLSSFIILIKFLFELKSRKSDCLNC